ncbi:hypothetical protein [Sphingopyxis sp.]
MFILVRALMGLETMQSAFRRAIEEAHRFYSYRNASPLVPQR